MGATDLRKGFEGLFGLVRDRLLCCPTSGHVFLFCNQQRNRLKLMVFDGTDYGFVLSAWGTIRLAQAGDAHGKVTLSQEELTLLVSGIDLSQTERKRWYRKVIGEELSQEKTG